MTGRGPAEGAGSFGSSDVLVGSRGPPSDGLYFNWCTRLLQRFGRAAGADTVQLLLKSGFIMVVYATNWHVGVWGGRGGRHTVTCSGVESMPPRHSPSLVQRVNG